jgi:hypothetical protein
MPPLPPLTAAARAQGVRAAPRAALLACFACLACLVSLASCASDNAAEPVTEADAGVEASTEPPVCAADQRAETYTPGLVAKGESGVFSVSLLSISPAPTAKGDNSWQLRVVDADGAPVDGLTIAIKPFMPDHGHGSSITPQITPQGADGRYDITRLNLFMPGLWQITLSMTAASGAADKAVYTFCVGG